MIPIGYFHKKARRSECFFNMVEIALALAVVAIGVVSIVALFPVGMEASRDAIADSYAADSADHFLSYFRDQLQNTSTGWSTYVTNNQIPMAKPYTAPPGGKESNNWTTLSETPLIQNHSTQPGVFQVQVQGGNNVDFSGVFRLWRSDVKYSRYDGNAFGESPLASDIATALNVEVSWPSLAPYPARKRALYYLEVFNP
jgi:hypothetical protein